MLYGAIAGDIAGSTREFVGMKANETELIPKGSSFTDDSILTIAIADAIMSGIPMNEALRAYVSLYERPMGGYGGMFLRWIMMGPDTPAYGSFGNGSAMRVSACAWARESLDEVLKLAKQSAECSHNHPEGIKGAEATAAAIFLARKGKSKDEICEYIHTNYYDMSRTYEDLRNEKYMFHGKCQDTVPEAIICFLESKDFESALRMAMLTNRDADTAAAICGAIAGAYYGVPENIKAKVRTILDENLLDVLDEFEKEYGKRTTADAPAYNSFPVNDSRIWGGEYPFDLNEEIGKKKLLTAIEYGITHFIDLTEEGELSPYEQFIPESLRVSYERFPISDTHAPASLEATMDILKRMDSILKNPNARIYLHCWGGVGRTCTIVACWIAWKERTNFFDTLRNLDKLWAQCPKSERRTTPDTEEQIDFIQRFVEFLSRE